MGGALASRWLAAGVAAGSITVFDPAPGHLPDALQDRQRDSPEGAELPALVLLAVKPQQVTHVATQLKGHVPATAVLVSMLAGIRVTTLSQLFPGPGIARIMPNTPARVGAGVTAMYGPALSAAQKAAVAWLLSTAGRAFWLEDEARFDAVTALSGSGPAYVFRMAEALAGAGEAAGLDPATAAMLANETLIGAARLLAETGSTPFELRAAVTSPNGTTQAGLDVLDGAGALSTLMRATVRAAADRSRALAAAAEQALATEQAREVAQAKEAGPARENAHG